MVEIILREDIEGVGRAGSVIKVKDGFARNYLFPKGLAFVASANNLKKIEQEKMRKETLAEKEKKQLEALAQRLNGLSCTVVVDVNEKEKLYGSVTTADIAKSLAEEGLNIEKDAIILEGPIEELGIYEVEIRIHPEIKAKI